MKIHDQVVCLTIFSMVFVSVFFETPLYKSVFFLAIVFVASVIAVFSSFSGALIIAAAIPLNGIFRWNDLTNPVSAGFFTILILAINFGLFLRLLIQKRSTAITLRKKDTFTFIFLLAFLALVFLHVVSHLDKFKLAMLMAREYLIPFLTLPPFYFSLRANFKSAYRIFFLLFSMTFFVALINLFHFFWGLNIAFNRVVTISDGYTPELRGVLGFNIPRLEHFLGLSTQGAGSVFYITLASIGFILLSSRGILKRTFVSLGIIVLTMTAFLTVSMSAVVTTFLVVFWIAISGRNFFRWWRKVLWPLMVVVFIFGICFFPIELGGVDRTIMSYATNSFINPFLEKISGFSLFEFLFGVGLGLKGEEFHSLFDFTTIFDRWVFVVFLQLGFSGFLLMMSFWVMGIKSIYTLSGSSSEPKILYMGGLILIGGLGFSHGAIFIERLFSPMAMFPYAILLALNTKKYSMVQPNLIILPNDGIESLRKIG